MNRLKNYPALFIDYSCRSWNYVALHSRCFNPFLMFNSEIYTEIIHTEFLHLSVSTVCSYTYIYLLPIVSLSPAPKRNYTDVSVLGADKPKLPIMEGTTGLFIRPRGRQSCCPAVFCVTALRSIPPPPPPSSPTLPEIQGQEGGTILSPWFAVNCGLISSTVFLHNCCTVFMLW